MGSGAAHHSRCFLRPAGARDSAFRFAKSRVIFAQGDPATSVFYVRRGRVKVTVTSLQGKEAVIAILADGDFIAEAALAGQPRRTATATAITDCTLIRLEKAAMARGLREDTTITSLFLSYLLARNMRLEEDLIDHLFNCS